MSIRGYRSAAGLAVLTLVLAACPERKAVWITPGAAGRPVFTFGRQLGQPEPVPISLLRVDRCSEPDKGSKAGEMMWMIVAPDDSTTEMQTIPYGEVPPGYIETHRSQPLSPGCYEVTASAGAVARFFVDPRPRVTQ